MKNYVLAYYDSESGMEVLFCSTLEEAYDIMQENFEVWYEGLYDFPSLDELAELAERWNQVKIGIWQSGDSYIRYVVKNSKVYGHICDSDTFTSFEIARVG